VLENLSNKKITNDENNYINDTLNILMEGLKFDTNISKLNKVSGKIVYYDHKKQYGLFQCENSTTEL